MAAAARGSPVPPGTRGARASLSTKSAPWTLCLVVGSERGPSPGGNTPQPQLGRSTDQRAREPRALRRPSRERALGCQSIDPNSKTGSRRRAAGGGKNTSTPQVDVDQGRASWKGLVAAGSDASRRAPKFTMAPACRLDHASIDGGARMSLIDGCPWIECLGSAGSYTGRSRPALLAPQGQTRKRVRNAGGRHKTHLLPPSSFIERPSVWTSTCCVNQPQHGFKPKPGHAAVLGAHTLDRSKGVKGLVQSAKVRLALVAVNSRSVTAVAASLSARARS